MFGAFCEREKSMQIVQLDFFENKSEEDLLREEMQKVKESNEKVRKALFARHGELAKMYMELNIRMEHIERHICKGDK